MLIQSVKWTIQVGRTNKGQTNRKTDRQVGQTKKGQTNRQTDRQVGQTKKGKQTDKWIDPLSTRS